MCIRRHFPHFYNEQSPFYDLRLDFEEVIGEIVFFEGDSYKIETSCFAEDQYDMEIPCPRDSYSEFSKMVSPEKFIFINVIIVVPLY